jgi:hypothetical protein
VPANQRLHFIPRVFGPHGTAMLRGEAAVFDWMARLCPSYRGGYWQFYDLSNGGFFLAVDAPKPKQPEAPVLTHWHLACPNGYEVDVSFEAAGVVATMYAISHLMFAGFDYLDSAYDKLRAYALQHAEAEQIFMAID